MNNMATAIPLVDCPCCLGGGCHAIGRAPLGAPPDDVETNDCLRCDGSGKVPATRCDVCLGPDPVALEDDVVCCERCLSFAEHADAACPACLQVTCECPSFAEAS